MSNRKLRAANLLLLVLSFFLTNARVFAWDKEGHEAIVKLAFKLMPKEQQVRLYEILGTRDPSIIGNWADLQKKKDRRTRHLHYVDIPRDATNYDASRDCKNGCLVSELERLELELKSKNLSDDQRSDDLLYYIHFLSDLYQPFHCYGDDGGATQLFVKFDGERMSLHKVWDFGIINDHILDSRTTRALLKHARELLDQPLEQDVSKIAIQEHAIAVANLEKQDAVLPEDYAEKHWEIVELGLVNAALQIVQRTKDL